MSGRVLGHIATVKKGLICLAIGGFFLWWALSPGTSEVKYSNWLRVPCVIETADIVPPGPYSKDFLCGAAVRYRYEVEGASHTGDRIYPYDDKLYPSGMGETLYPFRTNKENFCYVNPSNPAESYLLPPRTGGQWFLLLIAVPNLLLGIACILNPFWARKDTDPAVLNSPIAEPVAGFLMLIFGLIGLLAYVLPLLGRSPGRTVEVPCTILSSQVDAKSGDGSTTYGVRILFQYSSGGHTYFSKQENYTAGSAASSWQRWAQDMVSRFPAGSQRSCWVEPDRPWDAVLEKEYRLVWWGPVIVMIFFLLGCATLYCCFGDFLNLLRRIIGLPPRKAA